MMPLRVSQLIDSFTDGAVFLAAQVSRMRGAQHAALADVKALALSTQETLLGDEPLEPSAISSPTWGPIALTMQSPGMRKKI